MTKIPKKPVAYEERLCLFLDILGFKQHVEESAKDELKGPGSSMLPFTVSRIHYALSAISRAMNFGAEDLTLSPQTSRQVTQFSDSIVVSYKLDEKSAVFGMLYDIYLLQIELIQHGILIRGAIAAGKLFHDQSLVFGPALVEAAELEKMALYPRVILSQEIIDLGKSRHAKHHSSNDEEKSIMSLLKQDLDGMFYIDYFGVSPDEFNDDWDDLYNHLIELRELIRKLSYLTRNPSLKLKHSWMRQKFNEVARPLEQSRFRTFNKMSVPEEAEDAFVSIAPFK